MMWPSISWAVFMWFFGVLAFCYWYVSREILYWEKLGVPHRKPEWWTKHIGGGKEVDRTYLGRVLDMYREFKSNRFGAYWLGLRRSLLLTDPDLIQRVLVNDFQVWSHRDNFINEKKDPLTVNLVGLNGKKWRVMRSKLTPVFSSAKLRSLHPQFRDCATQLKKCFERAIEGSSIVEAGELSARFATDIIGSCAFGLQMNTLSDENAAFRVIGKKVFNITLRQKLIDMLQLYCPSILKLLNLARIDKDITSFFINLTKQTIEYREMHNVHRDDMINLLIQARNSDQTPGEGDIEFTDEVMAAQVYIFFAAGFETSSVAISFAFYELAANEDIQDRLYDEINSRRTQKNEEITWEALKSMEYLDMIYQEILRKYPPLPLLPRKSVKPYQIPDTNIELPSGSICIIPIYALHHDPEYYPDPDTFDPLRFTEEAKRQRPAQTYLPFGGGPRTCIGLRFFEQEIKYAIVTIVENFVLSLSEKTEHPMQIRPNHWFICPKGGIWLQISKRFTTSSDM